MFFKTYPRWFFLAIACFCGGLIILAMYLQNAFNMLPCPICILERYAFILIGLFAFLYWFKPKRIFLYLALIFSVCGALLCLKQMHSIYYPVAQCGKDALEAFVNNFFLAHLLPSVFKAMSLCNDTSGHFLGLNIVYYALFWFIVFGFIFSKQLKSKN